MHEALAISTSRNDTEPTPSAVEDADRVKILIVDDLPENRMAYCAILEELGQEIVTAGSGRDALKLVLQHEFAVILLDVNLPEMDGFEIATLIRSRRGSARTPIIFLTAFTDEVRMAQGYASGAVDYLPTPVVPGILQAKVRVFIELSQMRRQAALQAEERARRTAAEEADRRKDEFLGMLSHELRNPLGPILNAAHLLRRIATDDARLQEVGGILDRQVKHMTRLIDDLLDATRLAHGKILLRKERCDLVQIIRQTVEDYRSIFDMRQLRLETSLPNSPVWMTGDPTRLVQSIGNLLHNAHKFTDPGGLVKIALETSGQTAEIRVTDTGIGIDAALIPHVFEVFRQAEQGLDHGGGGLGLGLALLKGLIELHGGDVFVSSDGPGKGTKFTLRLPIEGASVPAALPQPGIAPSNPASCRVLLIEDNKLTAESTQMLLSMDGYEVHMAHSGPSGLEMAKTFRPQVILCDIGLPGMDGYQVARQIRQDTRLSSSYMIALTGYGREQDLRQTWEAGFDLHMIKPVDYENLRRTLAALPARNGGHGGKA